MSKGTAQEIIMFNPSLMQIGNKLVELCNADKTDEALETLYSKDVISVEPMDYSGQGREAYGLEQLKAKHDWWNGAHEVHSASADGPYFHGEHQFTVIFDMDTTVKETGERVQMKDIGLYSVVDGQITREEFLYGA